MVDVRRVKLPGVGVLHTFVTDDGGKVGVSSHRSGHSDLITFADAEDGTAKKVSLRLDEDEAHTLAELLGGKISLAGCTKDEAHRDLVHADVAFNAKGAELRARTDLVSADVP